MQEKKRILIVMPTLYNGGAERSLVNFLNLMDYSQYEVDLLLFKHEGLFLEQIPENVRILDIPLSLKYAYHRLDKSAFLSFPAIRSGVLRLVGTLISIVLYGRRKKRVQFRWKYFYKHAIVPLAIEYDIALAYLHGEPIYYIIDKVKAHRKIVWIHNDYDKVKADTKFDKQYFERANWVVTISEECKNVLIREFPDLQNKFCVLPNLTSSEVIKKLADAFVPHEYPDNTPLILSIGRLSEQKGFDYAIAAASILKQKGFKFKWFIIGDGPLEQELKKQITEADADEQIELLGTRANPYPYINYCDIFVQPSRFEGKSVVLDEAKILTKPIVVTEYATVHDQITDEREGMIVQISAQALANGIEKMLKDNELRAKYSQYLRQNCYDNAQNIDLYYMIINQ